METVCRDIRSSSKVVAMATMMQFSVRSCLHSNSQSFQLSHFIFGTYVQTVETVCCDIRSSSKVVSMATRMLFSIRSCPHSNSQSFQLSCFIFGTQVQTVEMVCRDIRSSSKVVAIFHVVGQFCIYLLVWAYIVLTCTLVTDYNIQRYIALKLFGSDFTAMLYKKY